MGDRKKNTDIKEKGEIRKLQLARMGNKTQENKQEWKTGKNGTCE